MGSRDPGIADISEAIPEAIQGFLKRAIQFNPRIYNISVHAVDLSVHKGRRSHHFQRSHLSWHPIWRHVFFSNFIFFRHLKEHNASATI